MRVWSYSYCSCFEAQEISGFHMPFHMGRELFLVGQDGSSLQYYHLQFQIDDV